MITNKIAKYTGNAEKIIYKLSNLTLNFYIILL